MVHVEDVQDVHGSESSGCEGDHDHSKCTHEHHNHAHNEEHEQEHEDSRLPKGERKAMKVLEKLNLTQLSGVKRVTIKKSKGVVFVVQNPRVFKCPDSDTYVLLGQPRYDDFAQMLQQSAAKQFAGVPSGKPGMDAIPEDSAETSGSADEGIDTADETGLDTKDIELVMEQGNCSRQRAVAALRKTNGDFVEAILSLSDK